MHHKNKVVSRVDLKFLDRYVCISARKKLKKKIKPSISNEER